MNNLTTTDHPAQIIPGAVPESLIPGFKCPKRDRAVRMLFIGGPCDGRHIPVPPDGRHYYYRRGDDEGEITGECWIYIPAVIRFKDRITAVYLFDERIKAAEQEAITGPTDTPPCKPGDTWQQLPGGKWKKIGQQQRLAHETDDELSE